MDLTCNPSTQEWNLIKAKFTQLYHNERRSLKEVRRQLQEDDGFIASENAFKRKITSWGLQRSFNKATTEALKQHICEDPHSLCERCSQLFSNQSKDQIKYQRYRSAARKKRSMRMALDIVLYDPRDNALRAGHCFWLHHAGTHFSNAQRSDLYDSTLVSELTDISIYLELPNSQQRVASKVQNFRHLVRANSSCWPVGILVAALWLVVNSRLQPYHDIRLGLFQELRANVMTNHNIDPNLRCILLNIETLETLESIAYQMISVQIQTLLIDIENSVAQFLGLIMDSVLDLVHCRQPSEALQWTTLLMQPHHFDRLEYLKQREATALMARCNLESQNFTEAVHIGRAVVSDLQLFVDMGDKSSAYTYINTCNVLARSYEALNNIEGVVWWRTRAYNTSLSTFGEDASNTTYHLKHLTKATAQLQLYQGPSRPPSDFGLKQNPV